MRYLRFLVIAGALLGGSVNAAVVESGYLPLADGLQLHYTVTRPEGEGRYPTILMYDPYDAGVASDPRWVEDGYAFIGVNFRGTGCSQGTFQPLRADQWGQDGAEASAWIAQQPWSDGQVGMVGYSFTGVSQLSTASFAGAALKAIAPWNVFTDYYRDMSYPGGVLNSFIPLWVAAGRVYVGSDALRYAITDPTCSATMATALPEDSAQTVDLVAHPHYDAFWSTAPQAYLADIDIPVLGCGNWQDTTIYSRAVELFRRDLNPGLTWFVGSNGTHYRCPIPRDQLVRFFDRFLKGQASAWPDTPKVWVYHEINDAMEPRWVTEYADWGEFDSAISPLTLYLHDDGSIGTQVPASEAGSVSYSYPANSANTPRDWTVTLSHWNDPAISGSYALFTTPLLATDLQLLGGGSVNLWFDSTALDTDVQVTLSEVRPDGQEMYIVNGWLRASHRREDAAQSTVLRPVHTHLESDNALLEPQQPVLMRVELLPFNHVFRSGSSIRLSIDTPGGWFVPLALPAVNRIHTSAELASTLVLGRVNESAPYGLPACTDLVNQPCRANAVPVPEGSFDVQGASVQSAHPVNQSAGGVVDCALLAMLMFLLGRSRLGCLAARVRHESALQNGAMQTSCCRGQ